MIKKYTLLVPFFISVLLIMPNFSFGATSAEIQTQIKAIMAQIQLLQQQLAQLQNQQSSDREWCHTFDTDLKVGDTGDEIGTLQYVLWREGVAGAVLDGSVGGNMTEEDINYGRTGTARFGEQTASAVTGFQEKYRNEILTPLSLKYGTGYVGKSTRAKLNQLYGCGGVTKPPVSAGYLEIEPSSASIAVGGSVSMQAIYQPPMPKCPEGFACPQVMPTRFPVVAEWTSSNPKVASIVNEIGSCMAIGCPVVTTITVKGISNGTADIKAAYKSPSGVLLTATAKVVVSSGTGTNNPPVINGIPAIPSSIKVDQSVLFSWNATDADGDNLSWSVSWGDGTGVAGACESPNVQNKQGWTFAVSHAWAKSGTYTVKATVNDCKGGSDTHTFNVTVGAVSFPSLTVLSPNGGETWVKGTTQPIKWQDNTPISSCPAGAFCAPIAPKYYDIKLVPYYPPCAREALCAAPLIAPYTISKNVQGSLYYWSVGKFLEVYGTGTGGIAPDGSYTVQVCQSDDTNFCDSSNSYFKIVSVSQPSITVTSPNGGEVWQRGTSQTIRWKSTSDVSNVYIKLRKGKDTYYGNEGKVSDVIPNSGFYQWVIPNTLPDGSDYGIRVAASTLGGTEVFLDDSDAAFSIVANNN